MTANEAVVLAGLRVSNDAAVAADLAARRPVTTSLPPLVRVETTTRASFGGATGFPTPKSTAPTRELAGALFERLVDEVLPAARRVVLGVDGDPLEDPLFRARLAALSRVDVPLQLVSGSSALARWLPHLAPRLAAVDIVARRDATGRVVLRDGASDETATWKLLERACGLRGPGGVPVEVGLRVGVPSSSTMDASAIVMRASALGLGAVHLQPLPPGPADEPAGPGSVAAGMAAGAHGSISAPVPSLADAITVSRAPWLTVTIDVDGMISIGCPRRLAPAAPATLWNPERGFQAAWNAIPLVRVRQGQASLGCPSCPHWMISGHG